MGNKVRDAKSNDILKAESKLFLGQEGGLQILLSDFSRQAEYHSLRKNLIQEVECDLATWPVLQFPSFKSMTKSLNMLISIARENRSLNIVEQFKILLQGNAFRLQIKNRRHGLKQMTHQVNIIQRLYDVFLLLKDDIVFSPDMVYLKPDSGIQVKEIRKGQVSNYIKAWLIWAISNRPFQQCLTQSPQAFAQLIKQQRLMIANAFFVIYNQKLQGSQAALIIKSISERGPQLGFKLDSLHAHQYFNQKRMPSKELFLFTSKGNKVFVMKEQGWKVISAIEKRNKIRIENSSIIYFQYEQSFVFINPLKDRELLKLQSICLLENEISQVQTYQKLPFGLKFPTILANEETKQILLFPGDSPISYIISLQYDQDTRRLYYQLSQGLCTNTRSLYFLSCQHFPKIFMIFESPSIFSKGIQVAFWDLSSGSLSQLSLKFACDKQQIYQQFLDLDISITKVQLCVQLQHNVLFVLATKIPLILDLNFKVFFSFCSRDKLKTFLAVKPSAGQYPFKFRHQNFRIDLKAQSTACTYSKGLLSLITRSRYQIIYLTYKINSLKQQFQLVHASAINNRDLGSEVLESVKEMPLIAKDDQTKGGKLYNIVEQLQNLQNRLLDVVVRDNLYMMRKQWLFDLDSLNHSVEMMRKEFPQDVYLKTYYNYIQKNNYLSNIVFYEYAKFSLQDQIREVKKLTGKFSSWHLAYIVQQVSKALIHLQTQALNHGNFDVKHFFYNSKNSLKLTSFYQQIRSQFVSDQIDYIKLLVEVATLEPVQQEVSTSLIQKRKHRLLIYKGFAQYCEWMIKDYGSIKTSELASSTASLVRGLQLSDLDIYGNKKQTLFQFNYGHETFVKVNIRTKTLQRFKVQHIKYQRFKFSKYDSFCYFEEKSLLFILQAKSRRSSAVNFVFLNFSFQRQTIEIQNIKLEKLDSFPAHIIKPIFYLQAQANRLFSFGGMESESQLHLYNRISQRVFCYDIIKDSWTQLNSLLYSIVSARALPSSKDSNQVLLFGGATASFAFKENSFYYIIYDVEWQTTKLIVDPTIQSPFSHQRLFIPLIAACGNNTYMLFKVSGYEHMIIIFSLNRGQEPVQFKIEEHRYFSKKEQKEWLLHGEMRFSVYQWKAYYLDGQQILHVTNFTDMDKVFTQRIESLSYEN